MCFPRPEVSSGTIARQTHCNYSTPTTRPISHQDTPSDTNQMVDVLLITPTSVPFGLKLVPKEMVRGAVPSLVMRKNIFWLAMPPSAALKVESPTAFVVVTVCSSLPFVVLIVIGLA